MSGPSTIYFPLRSNASALVAGQGVASVRRRILAAALLMDRVILEDGLHVTWAGPRGAQQMTGRRMDRPFVWQSTRRRGKATGATHYVSLGREPDGPLHPIVVTEATFSFARARR